MIKLKRKLSTVMIAIFSAFIMLSGMPANAAVSAATAKKQITTATSYVAKVEGTVKVSTFVVTTAQAQYKTALTAVSKIKTYGKTYLSSYNALVKRLNTVNTKINTRAAAIKKANDAKLAAQKAAEAAAAEAAKILVDAQTAVDMADELVGDSHDLVGSDTDLANAKDAVAKALQAISKLDAKSSDFKGLNARVESDNAKIVKAMDDRDAAAQEKKAQEDEAKAVAAAEEAVKAAENAPLKTADDLTKSKDLGKTAAEAVLKVKEADKAAEYNSRLKVLADNQNKLQSALDEAKKPPTITASAVNGAITITFSKKPLSALAVADFSIKNGSTAVSGLSVQMTNDTTAVINVPNIAQTTDADQSIVYTVSYQNAAPVSTAAFSVPKLLLPAVTKVENTAVDTLKVTLSKPVDTTKVTLSITRTSIVTAYKSITWNSDKTEATIVFYYNLTPGDYLVTLGGVPVDATKNTGAVTVKASTVTKIDITGNTAAMTGTNTATVGFTVTDQFGTDITKTCGGITVTSSGGGTCTVDYINKMLIIGFATTPKVGDAVSIIVIDQTSGVVASKALTVGAQSSGGSISFSQLKNIDNKILRTSSSLSTDVFAFDVTAADQYGNPITDATKLAAAFTVFAPTGLTYQWVTATPGTTTTAAVPAKLKITAVPTVAGTYTFTILPNANLTAPVALQVTVADALGLANFTMSQPAGVLAANESIYIPFGATDQYGTPLTSYVDVAGKVTFNLSDPTHFTIGLIVNPVDNSAQLKLTALSNAPEETLLITSIGGSKGSVSNVSIPIRALAVPTRISAVSGVAPKVAAGASQTLTTADNFVVRDQYDRVMTSLPAGYTITLTSSDANLVSIPSPLAVRGVTAGTATITATITKPDSSAVANSYYTFNVTTVNKSDISSYGMDEIGTVYSTSSVTGSPEKMQYAKAFTVYGLTSSGEKVTIDSADVKSITSTNDKVDSTQLALYKVLVNSPLTTPGTNEPGTIVVIVSGANGMATVTKAFTITDAARVGGALTVEADTGVTLNGNSAILDASAFNGKQVTKSAAYNAGGANNAPIYFTVKDQYGVASSVVAPTYYSITNTDINGIAPGAAGYTGGAYVIDNYSGRLTVTSSRTGDVITVTGITKDGKVATLKIVVK